MNAEVERLFEAALGLPDGQRADFLAQQCSDPEVRQEVESLLNHDRGAATFLESAVQVSAASVAESLALPAGQRLGAYRILSPIGRGGMGIVYLAERADGQFEQRVAIKIVQTGAATRFVIEHMEQERRILASLEHPNIARLLDAGATAGGVPYFVMEYVAGQPVDRYCEQHALPVRERLRLFLAICDAVQLAHQKLIVHRDLKPDNILVGENGVPKLLDFGIAKVLEAVPAGIHQTATRVLTPEYASPEQIRGEPVSTATDIYSLGGVLYRLLTGVPPHPLDGKSPAEAVQIICEQEIRPPGQLRRELAGDLGNILQMALRKEAQRRYRSVEQFAADVRAFLAGQPVLASPDTVWYRCGKFVRRHWLGATAALAVALALGSGAGVAMWQKSRAERRFNDVRRLANVFLFDFEGSIHDLPGATKARQLLVRTALEYLENLSREASGDPSLMRELASAYDKVGDIQGSPNAGNVGDAAGAARSYQQALTLRRSLSQHGDPADRAALAGTLLRLVALEQRTTDLDAAMRHCQEAISLLEPLRQARPSDPAAAEQLANADLQLGRLEQRHGNFQTALDHLKRGLALEESAASQDPAKESAVAGANWTVGQVFEQIGNYQEAKPYYAKSLAIYERLLQRSPSDAAIRRRVMIGLASLGIAQWRLTPEGAGLETAVAEMREANTIADEAVAADPYNAEAVSDLMAVSARLGLALSGPAHRAEAKRLLDRGLEAATSLARRDPGNRENQLNLGMMHSAMAVFAAQNGDPAQAIQQRQIAAQIYERLAEQSPNDAKILASQVSNWQLLASLLASRGDWQGAHRNYALGLQVTEKMAPVNPGFASQLDAFREAEQQAASELAKRR